MGSGSSVSPASAFGPNMAEITAGNSSGSRGLTDLAIAQMPQFFIFDAIIHETDEQNVRSSWNKIVDDQSAMYLAHANCGESFPYMSCISWLIHSFYDRLFAALPESKKFFKTSLVQQGHKLVEMITLCLEMMAGSREVLVATLTQLGKAHNSMGIYAHQYGVFVSCLLRTLDEVLGPADFRSAVRHSWEKALSRLLEILVPVAIQGNMVSKAHSRESPKAARRDDEDVVYDYGYGYPAASNGYGNLAAAVDSKKKLVDIITQDLGGSAGGEQKQPSSASHSSSILSHGSSPIQVSFVEGLKTASGNMQQL